MTTRRDKGPHRTFGDVFGRVTRGDFSSFTALKASPIIGWASFVVLCIAITALMTFSISEIPSVIMPGQIASRDIKADKNYEIVDEEATQKFKEEALTGVLDVYDYDDGLDKALSSRVTRAFDSARSAIAEGKPNEEVKLIWENEAGIELGAELWLWLWGENLGGKAESGITSALAGIMNRPLVANKEGLLAKKERGILLRPAVSGGEKTLSAKEINNISSVEEALNKFKGRKTKLPPAVFEIAKRLVAPNMAFNLEETLAHRAMAVENVKNVVIKVEAGEIIIRNGSRYEPRHVMILEGIRREKALSSAPLEVVGTFLLIVLVILSTYYFAERFIKKFAPQRIDLYFIGFIVLLILAVLRLSLGISNAIHDSIAIDIPRSAFHYGVPVAAAAMLVRFILNSETALVFSIVISIFAGVFVENNLNYTAYCLISSVAAAASIAYADKRSAIIRAGAYTSIVNVFAAIGIHLVNASSLTEPLTFLNILWYAAFAVLGGMSCVIFMMVITPFAETLFGFTTDIKLLELANLNHPLLRELVIRAPGTYHHSHLVGILAESAAEAIGANPLFARVAAYYHDIGKIRKPQYFTENTREGESRYEKLSPHMSALIVSSHVKDGIELAKEYKVPQKIIDMIPQHHGTKMISFFYEKAKEQSDPLKEKLDEKDFRYPGPKPQTREAGILLLADAVEAAVRSLKEKSPTRVQQTVEEVINKSFTEAQLDECDLTLRNLYAIAKSFTKILMGIYHQRIEYPKEALVTDGQNAG